MDVGDWMWMDGWMDELILVTGWGWTDIRDWIWMDGWMDGGDSMGWIDG